MEVSCHVLHLQTLTRSRWRPPASPRSSGPSPGRAGRWPSRCSTGTSGRGSPATWPPWRPCWTLSRSSTQSSPSSGCSRSCETPSRCRLPLSSSLLLLPQAELDFQQEAANSVRCAQELAGLEWLYVPPVVKGLSSQVSHPPPGIGGSESVSFREFSPPSSSTGSRSATWLVSPPWASASTISTPSLSECSPSR